MKILIFLLFLLAFSIIVFKNLTKDICIFNSECGWKIVNCCPEEAFAKWECVNLKTFKEPECPEFVICPKIYSPKPNLSCVCEKRGCVAK